MRPAGTPLLDRWMWPARPGALHIVTDATTWYLVSEVSDTDARRGPNRGGTGRRASRHNPTSGAPREGSCAFKRGDIGEAGISVQRYHRTPGGYPHSFAGSARA